MLNAERNGTRRDQRKSSYRRALGVSVGITLTGEREMLEFRVGDRKNHLAWEDLLQDLINREIKINPQDFQSPPACAVESHRW